MQLHKTACIQNKCHGAAWFHFNIVPMSDWWRAVCRAEEGNWRMAVSSSYRPTSSSDKEDIFYGALSLLPGTSLP